MNVANDAGYQPFPKLAGDFVAGFRPGWRALIWAADHHWLDLDALAALAEVKAAGDENALVEIATAAIDRDEPRLRGALEKKSSADATTDAEVRDLWIDVAIAWAYANRHVFDDPWAVVEEIWEAFDHAPQLNNLIRWMPVPSGEPTGEEAMLNRWRSYIEDRRHRAG